MYPASVLIQPPKGTVVNYISRVGKTHLCGARLSAATILKCRWNYTGRKNLCSPFGVAKRFCDSKPSYGCTCKVIGRHVYRVKNVYTVTGVDESRGKIVLIWRSINDSITVQADIPEVKEGFAVFLGFASDVIRYSEPAIQSFDHQGKRRYSYDSTQGINIKPER
ncbi:hypothetical protein PoB_006081500 [Plakobranchus ocellatus]|uniref:Uncharacterized protein n=1 Tax=Plakobranchus ocellatus TaxID=259542 RepID=A0AAV4CR47_9GAST|nr:hypothetical protein PoB_006081500 [Plakobranchus ocellatus]